MIGSAMVVACAVLLSGASVTESAQSFFEVFVERNNRFDPSAASLYLADAKITSLRDGEHRLELTGAQLQTAAQELYKIAKARGDQQTFRDVSVVEDGERATVRATRTAEVKCHVDPEYRLDLAKVDGAWRIAAEHSSTVSLSNCDPSPKLKSALERTHKALAPQLPMVLDDETTLESITVSGANLIYAQRFSQAVLADLNVKMLVPALRQSSLQSICGDRALRAMISEGAFVRYAYFDRENAPVMNVDVSKGICP